MSTTAAASVEGDVLGVGLGLDGLAFKGDPVRNNLAFKDGLDGLAFKGDPVKNNLAFKDGLSLDGDVKIILKITVFNSYLFFVEPLTYSHAIMCKSFTCK